jgi:hypothetical protein
LKSRICALCHVTVAAAVAGCGSDEAGVGQPPAGFFGVNVQLLATMSEHDRTVEVDRQLDAVEALGADFARANLNWLRLAPARPAPGGPGYEFESTDAWVAALARHGLRWQVTGQGVPTPEWARDPEALAAGCDYRSPPADPAGFAELMASIAKRYGRDGGFWREHPELPYLPVLQYEVWNEANFRIFWCPEPDPQAYAALYGATAAAVHEVDPAATVIFGALAGFRSDEARPPVAMPFDEFLRRALAARPALAREIDAVGVHPYGATPDAVYERLGWLRGVVDDAGLAVVPMTANEFGWPTAGEGTSLAQTEETRAAYAAEVTAALATAPGCDLIGIALHTWVTPETNPADPESWYGIADPVSAAPYPTADAYADAITAIESGEEVAAAPDPCAG